MSRLDVLEGHGEGVERSGDGPTVTSVPRVEVGSVAPRGPRGEPHVGELRGFRVPVRERPSQPFSLAARDLVRDATIQRFEFTFEVVWKALRLYLERQGHECGGPRPTLKKAFAEGLLAKADDAEVWLRMLDDRNLTSQAYDEPLAQRIYGRIVAEYAPALLRMAELIQSLPWE